MLGFGPSYSKIEKYWTEMKQKNSTELLSNIDKLYRPAVVRKPSSVRLWHAPRMGSEQQSENHWKTIRRHFAFLGNIDGNFIEIISLKALRNYSVLIWYFFSICLWREPKNSHLNDFGILGRVQTAQHQLILSSETPGHLIISMLLP